MPFDLYYDVYVPQAAKRYLGDLPAGAPWFCWVSFGGPHPPYDTPEPYASLYNPKDVPPAAPRMNDAGEVRDCFTKCFMREDTALICRHPK